MEKAQAQLRQLDILLREANQSDHGFVIHSWVRSFGMNPLRNSLGIGEWTACKSYSEILVSRIPMMDIMIACNPEDPEQIFGYSASESFLNQRTIHFVYVKDFIRNQGIARRLLEILPDKSFYSYPSKVAKHLGLKFELKFNPFHFLGVYIKDEKENHAAITNARNVSAFASR